MAILKVANIHHDASGFTRTQISTANTVSWYTSNQERVILDSTGTVRVVGTVNASSILLDGVRATDISNSYAVTVGAASNTLANTKLANTTTTLAGTLTITGDAIVGGNVIFDSPASTRIWKPSVNTLAFITNSNESMRITSTGLVGIGTLTPTSNLHVVGDAYVTGSIDLGNASDTTISRSSAGNVTIEGNVIYRAGGTDVALADGGTGASLTDPNADRIMFWDDSATSTAWLEIGSGLSITGTVLSSSSFPSGTKMLFTQTTAPTGWTKDTTHDNKALRVVSGAASSGGTVAFTTAFASQAVSGSVSGSVGSTTLSTAQMPSHTHFAGYYINNTTTGSNRTVASFTNAPTEQNTSSTGGGGSHNHSWSGSFTGTAINLAVQYVDVIIATKD